MQIGTDKILKSPDVAVTGAPSSSLLDAIRTDQYAGYAYSYPHKTSYRQLEAPIALSTAWASEDKSRLFLYVHLPFCEMRCGFCNLFTTSQPAESLVDATLLALDRQSQAVAAAIAPEQIVQIAFGGGTPTYLEVDELARVFRTIHRDWPIANEIPFSVEVSPGTVTADKLAFLIEHGVQRISMGVQSFVDQDLRHLGRPQDNHAVEEAIRLIRVSGVKIFNLDLIYGNQGQTESDWLVTVEKALSFRPEEIFLYPLYVRQLTGLGRTGRTPAENRRHQYQLGRQRLLQAGYRPISMRMFRRTDVDYSTQHCCQEDGMIGLGPGARSYTSTLHYSTEYAVSPQGVHRIIADFNASDDRAFGMAQYAVTLDAHEQSRRYLIRSLLQTPGLDRHAFSRRFGGDVLVLLPQVHELLENGFATLSSERLRLTEVGIAHSDVIGPWLYSEAVKQRMEAFELQ